MARTTRVSPARRPIVAAPAADVPSAGVAPTGLTAVTAEAGLYALLLAVGGFFRLVRLGDPPLSPGESALAFSSWAIVHGQMPFEWPAPAYQTLTTLLIWLFGGADAVARLLPALAGLAVIALVWPLRPVIGRLAALLAAALFALSPLLTFFSRQAGSETLALAVGLALTALLFRPGLPGLAGPSAPDATDALHAADATKVDDVDDVDDASAPVGARRASPLRAHDARNISKDSNAPNDPDGPAVSEAAEIRPAPPRPAQTGLAAGLIATLLFSGPLGISLALALILFLAVTSLARDRFAAIWQPIEAAGRDRRSILIAAGVFITAVIVYATAGLSYLGGFGWTSLSAWVATFDLAGSRLPWWYQWAALLLAEPALVIFGLIGAGALIRRLLVARRSVGGPADLFGLWLLVWAGFGLLIAALAPGTAFDQALVPLIPLGLLAATWLGGWSALSAGNALVPVEARHASNAARTTSSATLGARHVSPHQHSALSTQQSPLSPQSSVLSPRFGACLFELDAAAWRRSIWVLTAGPLFFFELILLARLTGENPGGGGWPLWALFWTGLALLIAVILAPWLLDGNDGRRVSAAVGLTLLLLPTFMMAVRLGPRLDVTELTTLVQTSPDVRRLVADVGLAAGHPEGGQTRPVAVDAHLRLPLAWYLKEFPNVSFGDPAPTTAPVVIRSAGAEDSAAQPAGHLSLLTEAWQPEFRTAASFARWLLLDQPPAPTQTQKVILHVNPNP